jgi:hypothetical protein
MTWVRIDDRFPTHPKSIAAGPLARDLFVCGLAYCNLHLTDGIIHLSAISMLAPGQRRPEIAAARLVEVGLWEKSEQPPGWRVHDYHDWNKTKDEVSEIIELKRVAGRLGGRKSGEARRKQSASRVTGHNSTKHEADAKQDADGASNPSPLLSLTTTAPHSASKHTASTNGNGSTPRYPPEMFHTHGCAIVAGKPWSPGTCVDRAYVAAHPELDGHYPAFTTGEPKTCEAHR